MKKNINRKDQPQAGARKSLQTLLLGSLIMVSSPWSLFAVEGISKVQPLEFSQEPDQSLVTIQADGPFTFSQENLGEENQVVLQLNGVKLAPGAGRRIDTTDFAGAVKMVSAYSVEGMEDTVRVLIQLKSPAEVLPELNGNVLRVAIPNGASGALVSTPTSSASSSDSTMKGFDPVPGEQTTAALSSAGSRVGSLEFDQLSSSMSQQNKLTEFMENKDTRKFTGKPISIQVRDMDIADVLRLIGEASGFNIVVGEDVQGKITLSLENVPWDQVLDVVLHTRQLGAERNNNLLRVVSLSALRAEKEAELAAKQAAEAALPKVTRVFPISYANLTNLTTLLSQFGNSRGGAGGGGVGALGAATIQSDERTNSVIVQDLPENIDRMKKLIDILDTQTPQVLIEGKIVDASEKFAKNLQGQFAALGNGSNQFFAAFNGASTDTLLGSSGVATGPVGGASFGFSPTLTYIPGLARLNALLSLSETETETKVIQSPRLVVRSGAKAEIADSRPVAVPAPPTGGLGSSIQQFTIQSATLGLSVTPTVANDGNVKLLIEMTRGASESAGGGLSGVAEKKISTEVYVESGSTLVIGGIYSMKDETETGGFPVLRKIPILGALFGGETRATDRNELFIFITPRILNDRESLLTGEATGSAG